MPDTPAAEGRAVCDFLWGGIRPGSAPLHRYLKAKEAAVLCDGKRAGKSRTWAMRTPSLEASAVDIGVNVHSRVKEGVDRGTKSHKVELITAWGNINDSSSVDPFCCVKFAHFEHQCFSPPTFFTTSFNLSFTWKCDCVFCGVEGMEQDVRPNFAKDGTP